MSQTILVVSKQGDTYFEKLETMMLEKGYQTLSVRSFEAALERLQQEYFASVVVNVAEFSQVDDFLDRLLHNPFAAVTPLVILGNGSEAGAAHDFFHGAKTLFDQFFQRDSITPDALVEYLDETVQQSRKEPKRGTLSQVSAPSILQAARSFNFSGAIAFEKDDDRRLVYMHNGRIAFASSVSSLDLFGEFLCGKGILTETQLREALDYGKRNNVMIGSALVALKMLHADRLFPLLEEQMRAIVAHVFSWDNGDYSFLAGVEAKPNEAIFKIPVSTCIYEGVKLNYSEERLKRHFGDLNRLVAPNPNLADHLNGLTLSTKERQIVHFLSAPHSLQQVIQQSELPPQETLQLCFVLEVLDVCRITAPHSSQPHKPDLQSSRKAPTQPVVKIATMRPKLQVAPKPPSLQQSQLARTLKETFDEPLSEPLAPPQQVAAASSSAPAPTSLATTVAAKTRYGFIPGYAAGLATALLAATVFYFSGQGQRLKPTDESVAIGPTTHSVNAAATCSEPPAETPVIKSASFAPAPPTEPVAPVQAPIVVPPVAVAPAPAAPKAASPDTNAQFNALLKQASQSYEQGDQQKAKTLLVKALKLRPTDTGLLIRLANLAYDLDQEEDAMWYLKRVLEIDKRNAEAHKVLGGIYQMRNQPQLAVREYQLFMQYSDDSKERAEVQKVLSKMVAK